MKKIGLICATVLMSLTLTACGSSSSQKSTKISSSSSSTKSVQKHKSAKKNKQEKKKQSSISSASSSSSNSQASQTSTQQSSQNSSQQQAVQSAQQSNSQPANNGQINNAQDALNAAKAKYGNGNYHWTIMYDADTNQPIQNPDGSYFVKAIDPTQGTMTGTAQSVNVYPDGSMTNN